MIDHNKVYILDSLTRNSRKELSLEIKLSLFNSSFSENITKNPQKPKCILTEGPLFGSLKTLTFRTFSEISSFSVGFTDCDGVTALVRDTDLH